MRRTSAEGLKRHDLYRHLPVQAIEPPLLFPAIPLPTSQTEAERSIEGDRPIGIGHGDRTVVDTEKRTTRHRRPAVRRLTAGELQ